MRPRVFVLPSHTMINIVSFVLSYFLPPLAGSSRLRPNIFVACGVSLFMYVCVCAYIYIYREREREIYIYM